MNNINNLQSKLLILQINKRGYIIACLEKLLRLLKIDKEYLINKHISKIIDFKNKEYESEDIKNIL